MTGPVIDPVEILRTARLDQCLGPWLVDAEGRTWFDAIAPGCERLLGYNAAASFGVCQFAESWTGNLRTENMRGVGRALSAWMDRTVLGFSGKTPAVSPKSTGFPTSWPSPADLIRMYINQSLVDQFADTVAQWTDELGARLAECRYRFPRTLSSFTVGKLDFCLEISSPDACNRLHRDLQKLGVLVSQTRDTWLTIRLTLGWRGEDRGWLLNRLDAALAASENDDSCLGEMPPASPPDVTEVNRLVAFHQQLMVCKLGRPEPDAELRKTRVARFFEESLAGSKAAGASVTFVGPDNWPQFRDRVEAMQVAVYEPARQTSRATFEALLACPVHHAMALELDGRLIAIAFAASLDRFPNERGTLDDPARERPDVIYVADLTVDPAFRGGLGRIMKQAITLNAVLAGREAFHGRNRDRLAAGMWAINLGLGSYELKHLVDDYPDNKPYRDCIYYRCPLRWEPDQKAKVAAEMERLGEAGVRQRILELANGM